MEPPPEGVAAVRPLPKQTGTGDDVVKVNLAAPEGSETMSIYRSSTRFFFAFHCGIVFFSFLVLVSSALQEDQIASNAPFIVTHFVQYQLGCAQLSFAVSLWAIIWERLGLLENRPVRLVLSAFQLFFWFPSLVIGTIYGTVVSPVFTANGYFGSWGAFTAATIVFVYGSERFSGDKNVSPVPKISLVLLFFYSLMIMLGALVLFTRLKNSPGGFNNPNAPFNYVVLYISVGSSSAFLSLVFLLIMDKLPTRTRVILGTILWLWVGTGVATLTFGFPNRFAVGNGYYAGLFAVLASNGLLMSLRRARLHRGLLNLSLRERKELMSTAMFFGAFRGVTFSSMVVMISAILTCSDQSGCANTTQRYQIAGGAIPFVIGFCFVVPQALQIVHISAGVRLILAILFWSWWVAAFTVMTFFGAFQTPAFITGFYANGFFFCWIALTYASMALAEGVKGKFATTGEDGRLSNPVAGKFGFLLLILVGSTIELGAAIRAYFDSNHSQYSIYALSVGSISIVMVLIVFVTLAVTQSDRDRNRLMYEIGLRSLAIWWLAGTLILTFGGLFNAAVDNGYFSLFYTLGACVLGLSGIWRGVEE